jgi:hypothetical protein
MPPPSSSAPPRLAGSAACASLRQRRCSSSLQWRARTRRRRAYASDATGSAEWRFCWSSGASVSGASAGALALPRERQSAVRIPPLGRRWGDAMAATGEKPMTVGRAVSAGVVAARASWPCRSPSHVCAGGHPIWAGPLEACGGGGRSVVFRLQVATRERNGGPASGLPAMLALERDRCGGAPACGVGARRLRFDAVLGQAA